MAQIIIAYNPFSHTKNCKQLCINAPTTIAACVNHAHLDNIDQPMICLLNGQAQLRDTWQTTVLDPQDVVAFITLPQGGSGGFSKILRTILLIAIVVAAPVLGGAIAGAIGAGAVGSGLITAGIMLGGSALINVLIPAPSAARHGFDNVPVPSPTYSLQGRGNHARLGQPIPVIYGRHIIYPDLAATPYAYFDNNEQYLNQLHLIGHGEYDIESIRVDDTPIDAFDEITCEIVPPNQSVTLFPTDVVTAPEVSGQELLSTKDDGDYVGGFVANPAGTVATHISIDITMPRGLYYANDGGGLDSRSISWSVQVRSVDDDGDPLGDWLTLDNVVVTDDTSTPQRLTYDYEVTPARYEVRAIRNNKKDNNARTGNELRWSGLKSTLTRGIDVKDATLLVIKMRATDNLSHRSSRLINCIVTRKLPIWDQDTGWQNPAPTRSIAWALADIVRSHYGGGLLDNRLDLDALVTLDRTWQRRGDTVNVIFDQVTTVWEALTKIARCGRAVCFMQGGVIRFVRDEAKTLPIALFSPRNIVKNSFTLHYLLPNDDSADSVIVEYFSQKTWAPDEVTVNLPNSTAEESARVRLLGCTDKQQAIREGKYMAASNHYRRRLVTFQTELEGLIPTYGDLIAINHDMPSWGQGAEVVAVKGNILTLSEPLNWDESKPDAHMIGLRKSDGSITDALRVIAGDQDNQVIVQGTLDFEPYTGHEKERTHVAFGVDHNWCTLARVTAVKPRGDLIEITAVTEHPAVHTADEVA